VSGERRALTAWFERVAVVVPEERVGDVLGTHAPEDIVWDDEKGGWLVPSHRAVKEVNVRGEQWRSSLVPPTADATVMAFGVERETYEAFEGARKIVMLTGEEHARVHRWWMRVLSERRLATLCDTIYRPVIDQAIDRFAGRGRAELVDELADRVVLPINLRTMGIEVDEDAEDGWINLLSRYHTARHDLISRGAQPEIVTGALEAARELRALIMPFVRERRAGTGEDLISLLWRDAPDLFDPGWDENAICDNVIVMWEGGTHSLATAIGNALHLLASRPDLQEQLRAGGPDAAKAFVEEALRLYGPTVYNGRYAEADTKLCGRHINAGERVFALAAAAGRDGERHACPHEVDLGRKGLRDHFTFSGGPRLCPGHGVARTALREVVATVVERLPELRLDPDAEPPKLWSFYNDRAMSPVNVRFAPQP